MEVVTWCSPPSDAFSQIITNEGVRTLWNGVLPSLILVLNPAVQFMIYEAMKRKAGKGQRKVSGHRKFIESPLFFFWVATLINLCPIPDLLG